MAKLRVDFSDDTFFAIFFSTQPSSVIVREIELNFDDILHVKANFFFVLYLTQTWEKTFSNFSYPSVVFQNERRYFHRNLLIFSRSIATLTLQACWRPWSFRDWDFSHVQHHHGLLYPGFFRGRGIPNHLRMPRRAATNILSWRLHH